MSLQLRIGLIVTSMMLIFMCSLVAMDVRHSRAAIAEEIRASNLIAVNLLRRIDTAFIHGDPAGFLMFLERTGRIRANDIALYDAQGRLRYQSPPSQYKPGREAPRWYARLVEPALPVTQLPLKGAILQVRAHTSRAVLDAWDELRGQLLTALALLVLSQLALLW